MSVYSHTLPTFGMVSSWYCSFTWETGTAAQWSATTPTTVSQSITFPVALPFDAYIHRVWLSMGISNPTTGSAIRRVNGISIPSSGEVEITDLLDPMTTEYKAEFVFRANGAVYQSLGEFEARLTILEPTINIEYTSLSHPEDPGTGDIIADRPLDSGVQLPRLLDKEFREVARIAPLGLRLEINIDPMSAAVLRAPLDEPEAKIGDFMELFSPHGSVGIFRVTETETQYGSKGAVAYYLEHAIGTLADSLAVGVQTISAPVATVIATLLETQNVKHWVLGDCEVPEDYELIYEYSYENLLQALTNSTAKLPAEYAWEFDMTRHPFVMHLRRLPDGDGCEMRMSRNLSSVALTMDNAKLCTRVIPFGAGEGKDRVTLTPLTGTQYLDSETASVWGLVSRTFTAESVYDAPTLKLLAERYLEKYDHPLVSIAADTMDLSEMTGEPMDYFRIGALCRLAMPDFGIVMRERVVSTVWPDVFGQPKRVEAMLANKIRDAADEIAELMREATNSKLLGGTVETVEETARAGSITPGSPFVQTFTVTGYGNVLNVKTAYRCVTSAGDDVECHITVDGNAVDSKEAAARVVDITKYVSKDETGVPLVGSHKVVLQPSTLNTVVSEVDNTITIKQIGKR